MKKSVLAIAGMSLVILATACNHKTTRPHNPQTTPAASTQQQQVKLTETYTNTKAGYTYHYPSGYSIVVANKYGNFVTASSAAINTDVQSNNTTTLVFAANEISMPALSTQSLNARIKTEHLNPNNCTITQAKVGSLNGYKVSDNVAADGITSDRYFVQNSTGTTFELLAVKNNAASTAILNSFAFTGK